MRDKSIAILVIFADSKKIDDYVLYLAESIKQNVEALAITVNGEFDFNSTAALKNIADYLFFRENTGFDCGAYKDTIETFLGWDNLYLYDELILINDSCYGPLFPLQELFETMDSKNLDFWGVTEQTAVKASIYNNRLLPYHIQSYFIVIKKKMLHSKSFMDFWTGFIPSDDYFTTVERFELTFTEYFNSHGYTSGAYIDCSAFCKSIYDMQAYIFVDSFVLISEHRCPFLKRKALIYPHEQVLQANEGETAYKTLEYIKNHTDYDENLIFNDVIRRSDPKKLYIALHNNFCLPQKKYLSAPKNSKKLIIAMCKNNPVKQMADILSGISDADIILAVNRQLLENETNYLKHIKVIYADSALKILEANNEIFDSYDYIGVINDDYNLSLSDIYISNLVSSNEYIDNIIHIFNENPRIGLLSSPKPYYGSFFADNSLTVPYGNMFWCHAELAEDIMINLNNNNIPELLRKRGYMYGTVMTEKYAALYAANYHFMLDSIIKNVLVDRNITYFDDIMKFNKHIVPFCDKYERIFIYGAGKFGHCCMKYLNSFGINVEGFVISDGQAKPQLTDNKQIYYLSEIGDCDNTGFVIALHNKYLPDVMTMFRKKNITDFMYCYESV